MCKNKPITESILSILPHFILEIIISNLPPKDQLTLLLLNRSIYLIVIPCLYKKLTSSILLENKNKLLITKDKLQYLNKLNLYRTDLPILNELINIIKKNQVLNRKLKAKLNLYLGYKKALELPISNLEEVDIVIDEIHLIYCIWMSSSYEIYPNSLYKLLEQLNTIYISCSEGIWTHIFKKLDMQLNNVTKLVLNMDATLELYFLKEFFEKFSKLQQLIILLKDTQLYWNDLQTQLNYLKYLEILYEGYEQPVFGEDIYTLDLEYNTQIQVVSAYQLSQLNRLILDNPWSFYVFEGNFEHLYQLTLSLNCQLESYYINLNLFPNLFYLTIYGNVDANLLLTDIFFNDLKEKCIELYPHQINIVSLTLSNLKLNQSFIDILIHSTKLRTLTLDECELSTSIIFPNSNKLNIKTLIITGDYSSNFEWLLDVSYKLEWLFLEDIELLEELSKLTKANISNVENILLRGVKLNSF